MSRRVLFWCVVPALLAAGCGGAKPEVDRSLVDRGRYVVEIMGCNDCHTPDYMQQGTYVPEQEWLIGSQLGYHGSWGTAYPTNLRLQLNAMSEQEWVNLARQMRRDSPMAWVMLPKLTDQDLIAIYRFVQFLGPAGEPAPARLPPGVTPATEYINFPEPH